MPEAIAGYWYVVCRAGGNPLDADDDIAYLVEPLSLLEDAVVLVPYCAKTCRPLDDEANYWAVFEARFVEGRPPRHAGAGFQGSLTPLNRGLARTRPQYELLICTCTWLAVAVRSAGKGLGNPARRAQ